MQRQKIKVIKKLTSFVAMVAVLFAFTTEAMAKKSKTLKSLRNFVSLPQPWRRAGKTPPPDQHWRNLGHTPGAPLPAR